MPVNVLSVAAVSMAQLPGDLHSIIFMSEILPTLIVTAGAVAAIGIGAKTYLRLKQTSGPCELAKIAESIDLLHESLDDIRAELHAQNDDFRELSGRIEFAERLLTKARDQDRL